MASFQPELSRSLQCTPLLRIQEESPQQWPNSNIASDYDDLAESSDQVILALELKGNGCLGSAYYTALEEGLFVQQDTVGGLELVEALIIQVQPTIILVPNRAADELVTYLQHGAQGIHGNKYRK